MTDVAFKTMPAAERDALPDRDFAYIDSSGGRHLPINDETHTRAAMSRFDQTDFESPEKKAQARSKILAAAKRFGIDVANFAESGSDALKTAFSTLMDGVFNKKEDKATMSDITLTASFSADKTEEDGDDILLFGRLFKHGDYPDKHFSLSPQELYDSIRSFVAPKPIDLEHRPTVFGDLDLTGSFGQLESVWADDAGEWMMAKARKPAWLHKVMPETRISATFNRASKEIIGAAWTDAPRVPGAELVAAFAGTRHKTPSGQMAMQRIHDVAAQSGAVCSRTASMASRHENKAIQQVHDMAAEHGAACESSRTGQPMFSDPSPPSPRRKRMNVLDYLRGKATEEGVDLDDADLKAAFSTAPEVKDLQEKVKKQEADLAAREAELATFRTSQNDHAAQFARLADEKRQIEAAAFSERQVLAHRLTPAAAEKLAPLAARIAAVDATATFAEGEKSMSALLAEFTESLVDLTIFTTDSIKNEAAAALFTQESTPGANGADPTKPDPDMVAQLLGSTPDGRAILKSRQNGA